MLFFIGSPKGTFPCASLTKAFWIFFLHYSSLDFGFWQPAIKNVSMVLLPLWHQSAKVLSILINREIDRGRKFQASVA